MAGINPEVNVSQDNDIDVCFILITSACLTIPDFVIMLHASNFEHVWLCNVHWAHPNVNKLIIIYIIQLLAVFFSELSISINTHYLGHLCPFQTATTCCSLILGGLHSHILTMPHFVSVFGQDPCPSSETSVDLLALSMHCQLAFSANSTFDFAKHQESLNLSLLPWTFLAPLSLDFRVVSCQWFLSIVYGENSDRVLDELSIVRRLMATAPYTLHGFPWI